MTLPRLMEPSANYLILRSVDVAQTLLSAASPLLGTLFAPSSVALGDAWRNLHPALFSIHLCAFQHS